MTLLVQTARRNKRSAATIQIRLDKSAHLVEFFGADCDICSLTIGDAERYLDSRRADGVSDHTIQKELATLRAALAVCKTHELFKGEPSAIMPREALRGAYKPRDRWLTRSEYDCLTAHLSEYLHDYVTVWTHAGLRYSEIFRITSDDVSFRARTLHVRGTKTDKSERKIPVNDAVLDVLRSRIKRDPMFPALWRGNVLRDLKRACAKAGIDPVTPNDLRRTFASWLANASVPELTVARLMGHTSSLMVRRVYGQLGDDTLAAAVDKLPRPEAAAKPQLATVTRLRGDK